MSQDIMKPTARSMDSRSAKSETNSLLQRVVDGWYRLRRNPNARPTGSTASSKKESAASFCGTEEKRKVRRKVESMRPASTATDCAASTSVSFSPSPKGRRKHRPRKPRPQDVSSGCVPRAIEPVPISINAVTRPLHPPSVPRIETLSQPTPPYQYSPLSTAPTNTYQYSPLSTAPTNTYQYSPRSTPPTANTYQYSPLSTAPTNTYQYSPRPTPPSNTYQYSPRSTAPTKYQYSPRSTPPTNTYQYSPRSTATKYQYSPRSTPPTNTVQYSAQTVALNTNQLSPRSHPSSNTYHYPPRELISQTTSVPFPSRLNHSITPQLNLSAPITSTLPMTPSVPKPNPRKGEFSTQNADHQIKFDWFIARERIRSSIKPCYETNVGRTPLQFLRFDKVPTLGVSATSCRVQEMFRGKLSSRPDRNSGPKSVFIKAIPIKIWAAQWDLMEKWKGEFVTDGENFVMEAACQVLLTYWGLKISPELIGIAEICQTPEDARMKRPLSVDDFWKRGSVVSHIGIITELYGEDLLDYIERRERKRRNLKPIDKCTLQLLCVDLLRRLHKTGICHLDFTPENILYGPDGLKLCDFAKATPLSTNYLYHDHTRSFRRGTPFHSCEPTIGKAAYMPPECWFHNSFIILSDQVGISSTFLKLKI
eukprot:GHVH01017088.1.p1 GENE.GHVH01017088.1~~GHVH01017088.1.p1  ORF type:complete len:698 (+),score=48.95 GHVH01017088.1:149-2095(+)